MISEIYFQILKPKTEETKCAELQDYSKSKI